MRILTLNYEFPPVGGGGGRASADLCWALARRGHSLRVLTTWAPGLPRRESENGYQLRRVFTGRRSLQRASLPAMAAYVVAAFVPALWQVLSWRPDLIHAHFAVPTGALALALSKLARVPYVLTVHLGDVPGGTPEKTGRWFRWLRRFTPPIWRSAAAVVAVSQYTRQLAQQAYGLESIRVIPNGVSLEGLGEVQPVGDPPSLIFAGRFQPQKNLPQLVDSLAAVVDLPWSCRLLGDGPERTRLEARSRERGLVGRLHFEGWVSTERVWQALGESDLLVMPSRSEGLPVVGVQALAQGVAICATRAGGLAELVEDDVNGRSCPVDDVEGFLRNLRWCLEDRERLGKMKQASRMRAQRYDLVQVAAEYEAAFHEILASPLPETQHGDLPEWREGGEPASSPARQSRLGKVRLAGSLLSLGFLGWLLARQDWDLILRGLSGLGLGTLLLAWSLMLLGQLWNAGRWFALLKARSIPLTFADSARLAFSGLFAANFLPTTVGGDVVRVGAVLRHAGQERAAAAASVLVDRLISLFGMAFFLPFAWPLLVGSAGLAFAGQIGSGVVAQRHGVARIGRSAREALVALGFWLRRPASLLPALMASWVGVACYLLGLYLIVKALGIPARFVEVAGINALVYFATLLPVTINGYGLLELGLEVLYVRLGASPEQATALALANRALMLAVSLPGALWIGGAVAGPKAGAAHAG